MPLLPLIFGAGLIILVLVDVFETIVLPRRVRRKFRLTRLFYRATWRLYSRIACFSTKGGRRENFLSYYGPLSLILLLVVWAAGIVAGFALLHWGLPTRIKTPGGYGSGFDYLYFSGTNFFTLGLGDITPISSTAKLLTFFEAGLGLGLLALVIGYLPSLSQSFSRRETHISLMDARAGSPPTACGTVMRQCEDRELDALSDYFAEWEKWCAELLESHLSYPVLAYFRSQHQNQSWLAAMTAILDACALVMATTEGRCSRQARLTFAIARHCAVDLALVFFCPPVRPPDDRLGPKEFKRMEAAVLKHGIEIKGAETERRISELREMYEPFVYGLSQYFQLSLPPWISEPGLVDNWQTSAWDSGARIQGMKDHF